MGGPREGDFLQVEGVIIFGLISSTALNMLVVPAAYYAAHTQRTQAVF